MRRPLLLDAALPEGDAAPDDAAPPDDAPDATDAATPTLLVTGAVSALDLDDTNLYYLSNDPVDGSYGPVVHGVPKSGGAPFVIASSPTGLGGGHMLHVFDGVLYVANAAGVLRIPN